MPERGAAPEMSLDWLPPGFDLGFLLRESRPTSLHDLVRKENRQWRVLFDHWLGRRDEAGRGVFRSVANGYDASGWRKVRRALGDEGPWRDLVGRFRTDCLALRHELKERRAEVARANPGLSAERAGRRAARERGAAVDVERASRLPLDDVRGLVRLEALVISRTREVKPELARTREVFGAATGWEEEERLKALRVFDNHHTAMLTAEGELRRATAALRALDPARRSGQGPAVRVPDDWRADLGPAWTGYLNAWADLMGASTGLAEVYLAWARKDTAGKVSENFAAVHPVANGCLLAVHTLLLSLRVCLVAAELASLPLTAGIGAEVVGIVNSAMGMAAEFADKLTRSALSARSARDDAVVREHLGRGYGTREDDPDALEPEGGPGAGAHTVGALAGAIPRIAETTGRSALHLATSTSQKAVIARSMPLVGEVLTAAGLVVRWHDQLFPDQLLRTDTDGRARLLAAFDHANSGLREQQVFVDAVTVHDVLPDGAFRVSFGERAGVLRDGRFSPDDPLERLRAVVAAWRRNSPPLPTVAVESAGVRYDLLLAGALATWDEVHQLLSGDDGATFSFDAYAMPYRAGEDGEAEVVRVEVAVQPDGGHRVVVTPVEPDAEEFAGLDGVPIDASALDRTTWEAMLGDGGVLDQIRFELLAEGAAGVEHRLLPVVDGVVAVCRGEVHLANHQVPYRLPLGHVVTPLDLTDDQWAALRARLRTDEAERIVAETAGGRYELFATTTEEAFVLVNDSQDWSTEV
ncbi:hypothetical protein [Umezawaea sp. Da 62-37]|uniref:hypothetical protein n=1 Tax=Umezawaea sp. Da 62-37 TaxID=3075927 RepID=UPI0028F6C1FD|nr:hypothetical protein [Umezawaea sp. Da 62-37]WNV87969.1 hypothetical protein RM788_06685 [Umezawaea sp. Da 62-37]